MPTLILNLLLIISGLFFGAISIWGKRFYEASWRKPLWGRIASAVWGGLLLLLGVLSLLHEK